MAQQQQKNFLVPIIMMILLFGMISFVTNLAAPMGVVVKTQFGLSNFQGMFGNFANFLAYACMGIPGGMLLQKVGYKKTALIAIAVGFIGVGVQFLSGFSTDVNICFPVYLLGAFIAGFSMCLLNTVVNPMLNTLGGGGKKGNQLIQVGGSFNSLCATTTPILVGALIGEAIKSGNPTVSNINPVMFIAMAVFASAFIVLSLVNIPEPHLAKTEKLATKSKYSAWSFRHFVLGTIAIFVYVGVEIGIPGTMNLFLADPNAANIGTAAAGSVAATYWFLMLIGRFTGASIGGKVSSKTMLTVASAAGIVLVLLGMFSSVDTRISMPVFQTGVEGVTLGMQEVPIAAMYFVLCGLCTSIMWGGIFNLAVEGLGKYVAAASGIFMMMVVGGGILPLIQNYIADIAGYMVSYWVIIAALAYMLYYALIGCKNVNKDIPVE